MSKIGKILVVSVCALVGVCALRAATPGIRSGNAPVREAAAAQILSQRQRTIRDVEQVAKENVDKPGDASATTAIILLGKLRATEAVPFLVGHLTFHVPYLHTNPPTIPTEVLRPCAGALVAIGSPSLDPLMENVAGTDAPYGNGLDSYVFETVLGKPASLAFVQEGIDQEHDPVRQQRLKMFLAELQRGPAGPRPTAVNQSV